MQSRLTLRVTTQVAPQSMAPGEEVTVPAVLVTVSLRVAVSVRSTGSGSPQICSCGLQVGGSAAAGPAVTASAATMAQSAPSTARAKVLDMTVSGSCGGEGRLHPASGNEIRSDGRWAVGAASDWGSSSPHSAGWRPPRYARARLECPTAVSDPHRLRALEAAELLDTPAEATFDRLTNLATRILGVPVALVSLVTPDRQFFKSQCGLPSPHAERRETPLSHSFCQYVVEDGDALIVEDAREDERLASNRAISDLGVIAYAGFPIRTREATCSARSA